MDKYFNRIFGSTRGSKQRREQYRLEEEIVEVIHARASNGGVITEALTGCVRRDQSLVEAALAAAKSEHRIHCRPNGRWYPGRSAP